MALTFKYKLEQYGHSKIKRPWVPVTLYHKDKKQDVAMLLDSGADSTLIPLGLAKYLGLDLTGEKDTTQGVGGNIETIQSKVSIKIGRGSEIHKLTNVPVIVADNDDWLILGRRGFFNKFNITFKENETKIIIRKVNKNKLKNT